MEMINEYIGFYEEYFIRGNKGLEMVGVKSHTESGGRVFSWEGKQDYILEEDIVLNKGKKVVKLKKGQMVMTMLFPLLVRRHK